MELKRDLKKIIEFVRGLEYNYYGVFCRIIGGIEDELFIY